MRQVTRTQDKSELDLIADFRQGHSEAIVELFGRHYPTCLSVARRFLHSLEESQDAVQSAYFSAFRHLDSFRGESSFKTWMTRLVINQCRMVLRKPARRFNWISLDDSNLSVDPIQLAAAVPTPEKCVVPGNRFGVGRCHGSFAGANARNIQPLRGFGLHSKRSRSGTRADAGRRQDPALSRPHSHEGQPPQAVASPSERRRRLNNTPKRLRGALGAFAERRMLVEVDPTRRIFVRVPNPLSQ